jgi:hypothetical protein
LATSAGCGWAGRFQQPGAGHHGQLLAEQRCAPHRGRQAVAQRQVDVGGLQVDRGVGGVDADVDVGVAALEGLQPRDQPHRCKAAQVVMATLLRPALWRIWRTVLSSRSSTAQQGAQQLRAGAGQFHRRVWRRNSGTPTCLPATGSGG